MANLADFYALYLTRNSNFHSETFTEIVGDLLGQNMSKTQFRQIGLMYSF